MFPAPFPAVHPDFPDELPPDYSGHVEVRIVRKASLWEVWLDIVIPDESGLPGEARTRKVGEHMNEQTARVAADWILRSAKRGRRTPPKELPDGDG